jgi:hypothetical protein
MEIYNPPHPTKQPYPSIQISLFSQEPLCKNYPYSKLPKLLVVAMSQPITLPLQRIKTFPKPRMEVAKSNRPIAVLAARLRLIRRYRNK